MDPVPSVGGFLVTPTSAAAPTRAVGSCTQVQAACDSLCDSVVQQCPGLLVNQWNFRCPEVLAPGVEVGRGPAGQCFPGWDLVLGA